MKYALVNGLKTESLPGMRGTCINCQSDTLAKCGQVKIWHWAHKSKFSCDPWWENETEWHRAWKNRFPVESQEVIHADPMTGEKHIADIKTGSELVIEFQHSAIDPGEIRSREAFYKNMIWVVDGTRLKLDYPRFCKGSKDFEFGSARNFASSIWRGIYYTFFPEECFPKRWLASSVPVYFDFQGIAPLDQPDENRDALWCLFPGNVDGWAVAAKLRREDFIEYSSTAPNILLAQDIRAHMAARNQQRGVEARERHELQKLEEARRAEALRQFWINPRRGRVRRF
jgi:competence protein CoiA